MLPLVTHDLPGLAARCTPQDRACEEVLLKSPARTGDFHWLKVAKTNLGTQQVRAAIARSVQIDVEHVTCAGHRDRAGRCVQWFSVPMAVVDNPGPLRRAGVQGKMQVLELTASHKAVGPELVERLRWRLRLRGGARDGGYIKARALMDRLRLGGLPNYIAAERLGEDGSLAKWGRMLLDGKRLPAQVAASGVDASRCLRAVQEWLFNRYLVQRVEAGLLGACLPGEVVRGSQGEITVVADPAHVEKRFASWEAVALGPLFGDGMRPAADEAAACEAAILEDAGLDEARVRRLRGDRRALRVQPAKAQIDPEGDDLTITCELPTDTYVTVLLDEFLRQEAAPDAGSERSPDAAPEPPDQP
jgi:tRNA pseudouridine13 synthase